MSRIVLGQYVYIESSYPRKRGDVADLQSIQFDPTGPRCLNFWFNVHGNNMGTLRVMTAPSNNTSSRTTIWQVYGQDFGPSWQSGRVTFSSRVPFIVSAVQWTRDMFTIVKLAISQVTNLTCSHFRTHSTVILIKKRN